MKRTGRKWLVLGSSVLLLGGGILLYTNNNLANAGQESAPGAKLNKVAKKPFALPKKETTSTVEALPENTSVDETMAIRPIEIEHGPQVTQEDLMNHKWIPFDPQMEEIMKEEGEENHSLMDKSVHTFHKTERQIESVNSETGEIIPAMKGETKSFYTLQGDIFHEEFQLTNQTLQATYQLSWQGSKILFNPYDEYDHKEERQVVLQPVEIVK
ncbi:hypothetical protein [Candidatus Enterococcus clewellii]|uniref:Uncharacterized protein n=1 Tax=Candidatus Enterococcus clewellii TaxID=1834193 RepID=A0A242K4I8_9ENTE|nr:hypothetical protein [Enterococcus sp. 9E7_DIV0242]OTP14440.1 hypothetical protein A5888_002541 [Enterococcus sp. 9E7_DIV0242]